MLVSEIFYSIQGEGVNAGIPVVFVRLAGCNLRCEWCDSKYAYEGNHMSIEDISKEIKKYDCRNVVFTGGEPLLQQIELFALIDYLRDENIATYFEVETNGTILPVRRFAFKVNQWNVSPKHTYKQIVHRWSSSFRKLNIMFKFVIDNKETLEKLKDIKRATHSLNHYVCFMPEGITKTKIEKNSKWLIEACKELKIRYSPRLHIMLWGNKRGK